MGFAGLLQGLDSVFDQAPGLDVEFGIGQDMDDCGIWL